MRLNWQDTPRKKLPRSVKRALYIADGVIGYVANMPSASIEAGIREFVHTYDFSGAYDPTDGPMDQNDQWEAELIVRNADGGWFKSKMMFIFVALRSILGAMKAKKKNAAAAELGRRGGKARAKKLSPAELSEQGRRAVRERWKKAKNNA